MGCFTFLEEIFSCVKHKSTEEPSVHKPSLSSSPKLRSTLTGNEILRQLRQEGIVPENYARGGVCFSVPVEDGVTPRRKPPRRLEGVRASSRLAAVGLNQYSTEEKQMMADIYRYDRYVEQTHKKALEREFKRYDAKKERERRQFMKKMLTQQKLHEREEKFGGREGGEEEQEEGQEREEDCKKVGGE